MNRSQIASALYRDMFYVLIHDHKHGYDVFLHSTYDKAYNKAIDLMKDMADIWREDISAMSPQELWSEWTSLSGDTEFFSIEKITLDA